MTESERLEKLKKEFIKLSAVGQGYVLAISQALVFAQTATLPIDLEENRECNGLKI